MVLINNYQGGAYGAAARCQRRALALGAPARRTPGHAARRADQRWLAPGVIAIVYGPSPTSIGVPAVLVAIAIGVTVPPCQLAT
jgi:hypothetical protein